MPTHDSTSASDVRLEGWLTSGPWRAVVWIALTSAIFTGPFQDRSPNLRQVFILSLWIVCMWTFQAIVFILLLLKRVVQMMQSGRSPH